MTGASAGRFVVLVMADILDSSILHSNGNIGLTVRANPVVAGSRRRRGDPVSNPAGIYETTACVRKEQIKNRASSGYFNTRTAGRETAIVIIQPGSGLDRHAALAMTAIGCYSANWRTGTAHFVRQRQYTPAPSA